MKDFSKYKAAYERRRAEEERELKIRCRRARAAAEKVAEMLADSYSVERVVLFGSVLSGRFTETSDIDLGVEGLKKEKYIKALVDAEIVAGVPVDIKPIEDVRHSLKERIRKTGEVLYQKK